MDEPLYEFYEDEGMIVGSSPFTHFNYRQWKKDTLWVFDSLKRLGEPTGFKSREELEQTINDKIAHKKVNICDPYILERMG